MNIKRAIKTLQRRSDHLKKRIDDSSGKDFSYDKAEKSAIDFAIFRLKRDPESGSTEPQIEREPQWTERN